MIIKHKGVGFACDNGLFLVGARIVGNSDSEYSGLKGTIKEVRKNDEGIVEIIVDFVTSFSNGLIDSYIN